MYKKIFQIWLVFLVMFFAFGKGNVLAKACCSEGDCGDYCASIGSNGSTSCQNAGAGCDLSLGYNTGSCYWSCNNSCTSWGPWSSCVDNHMSRDCVDGVHNADYEIATCDGTVVSCFPAGTKVNMENGARKNIEDVKAGEKVVSDSGSGKKEVSTVTKVENPVRDNMCRLNFSSGKNLSLTSEHPIMTSEGWKSISPEKTKIENSELKVLPLELGDRVIRENSVQDELNNISCWSTQVQTYNLLLDEGLHTYFADGVLVHNKAGRCPGGCCSGGANEFTCGCNSAYCCTAAAPGEPLLGNPVAGTEVKVGTVVNLRKTMPDGWGTTCVLTGHTMNVCIGSSAATCGRLNVSAVVDSSIYPWTAALPVGNAYWRIQADNGDKVSAWPTAKNFCVEGFSATNTAYLSAWSACSGYTRTRTCRDDCNALDDCAPYPLSEICCTDRDSIAPTLSTPAEAAEIQKGSAVSLNWGDLSAANWGTYCPGNINTYEVCATKSPGVNCLVASANTAAVSAYNFTPAASVVGSVTWSVRSSNDGVTETWSPRKTFCVEGFDAANTSYVSNWSACNSTHTRTRTCREDCGTNDCGPVGSEIIVVEEDCTGTITGTLFDASDLSACPADIGTNAAYSTLRYPNQSFDINGTWPVISTPVSTGATGKYSETVYASATNPTYSFDFADMLSANLAAGIKFQCQSATATVTTAGQTFVKDTGFWRVYGGWWQAAGGSVHAETGVKSIIPASVTLANQSLILPSTVPLGSRLGLLTYGASVSNRFGTNPNAKVSASLWEKESKYEGQVYDWNFYNTRFNLFDKTAWDGNSGSISYNSAKEYQIFSYAGNVTLNVPDPTGSEKIVYLIDGDVTVTSDIVVPDGAFLSVIASGSITFDTSVGRADGWYIADSIVIPCKDVDGTAGCDKTDTQFLGNGSFVSWGNIGMTRVLGMNANNTSPSEKFTYRMDLFLNAPTPMKVYSKVFKPFIP